MNRVNSLPNTASEIVDIKEHRDSFVFYHSFKEAIDEVDDAVQLTIYQSIANYALYRAEPKLEGVAKIVWVLIKPQLDANWRKYEKGCRGGASGKLGGRPRKNPLGDISKTANVNDNDNDNVNVNENVCETTTTPLLSEVIDFVESQRLDVDANYFYDYYTSNGWMMGKNPIADWKAVLRNWGRKSENEVNKQQITITYDL